MDKLAFRDDRIKSVFRNAEPVASFYADTWDEVVNQVVQHSLRERAETLAAQTHPHLT